MSVYNGRSVPYHSVMRWASVLSVHQEHQQAVDEIVASLTEQLGAEADLVLVFVSQHHIRHASDVARTLQQALSPRALLGCSGGGIIGHGREIEGGPALAVVAASLPDVEVAALHLTDETVAGCTTAAQWDALVGVGAEAEPGFVLLSDPFSFSPQPCLSAMDAAFGGAVIVGGLASGGRSAGSLALFVDDRIYDHGAALLRLSGNVAIDPVIAQGCRPIGEPMAITSCDQHVIFALDGKPPGEVLQALFQELEPRDRELLQHALFMGIEMRDQRSYEAGDFLIRNIVGLQQDKGALVVAAELERYQAVQFHLRDAATSADDLKQRLVRHAQSAPPPAGGLLFSCLGRGRGLYGVAHHDSDAITEQLGPVPMAGFFCNGEIGPVGGRTFLHGYTSAIGLFRPRTRTEPER